MFNGMKNTAIKEKCPAFTDSHGMKFDCVYVGVSTLYHEGKPLWKEETGIKRLSKSAAIADAMKQSSDYLINHIGN